MCRIGMTQFTVDIRYIYIYMSDKRKIQQGGKKTKSKRNMTRNEQKRKR
jgi:hypothetical protein